jgi:hypothetical protein
VQIVVASFHAPRRVPIGDTAYAGDTGHNIHRRSGSTRTDERFTAELDAYASLAPHSPRR